MMDNVTVGRVLQGFRPLFYLVPPSKSSFKSMNDVPKYVQEATPYFIVLIMLEAVVRALQKKSLPRINDSISSLTAGMLMTFVPMLTGSIEVTMYAFIYRHCRVADLPWDSPWTWWCAFIGVDFVYYWYHRMAHEVNLFWAAHQVHHSSEEYNLTTALRQSTFQRFTSMFFNLPMALLVPPAAYVVHKEFNLLYQFWIHTEVVSNLGPLEWVLNTPSHHRVHHGVNPYCIDKNYAGVLIIWDRIFGTFQPEKDKVVYGLVHQLGLWNPVWVQLHHYIHIWNQFWNYDWKYKFAVLLKGPGWSPGKPRLGCIEDIPQVSPATIKPYDRAVPTWLQLYCVIHFVLVLYGTDELGRAYKTMPYMVSIPLIVYFIFSLTCFGLMFDLNPCCAKAELVRLALFGVCDVFVAYFLPTATDTTLARWGVRTIALVSSVIWLTHMRHFDDTKKAT